MKINIYSGKFIVFEGLDGSGQSTQAGLLKDFLLWEGKNVILTKEPTKDSRAGQKIREALDKNKQVPPLSLQEFFAADRAEHLEKTIMPGIKEGKIVISDRYFFSSFAYGVSCGIDLEKLVILNENFLIPDLTFILKVRPEICLERIEKRGEKKTLFEETERLKSVWQTYEFLPDKFENIFIINGERPIAEVFEEVKKTVILRLNL